MRIIYLCPVDNAPTGGVKVIYRHAAALHALGAQAYVLHPFDTQFRCTWFDADVRFLDNLELHPKSDFVIIPEVFAGQFAKQCASQGVKYGIFVQNGYLTPPLLTTGQTTAVMTAAYTKADLLLVISNDTGEMVKLNYPGIDPNRILKVQYSVDPRFFNDANTPSKKRAITFMPRKLPDHCFKVVYALSQHLPPGWNLNSIEGVDEKTCAEKLHASRIFLAFSHFEGLPLPPLEAAIAGNFVIGYTGQGAREYWIEANFQEIHQGNIIGFVNAASNAAKKIDAGQLPLSELLKGATQLSERFSPAAETANLSEMLKRISRCFVQNYENAI